MKHISFTALKTETRLIQLTSNKGIYEKSTFQIITETYN